MGPDKAQGNAAHHDLIELAVESFTFDACADRLGELPHSGTNYDAWY
jgi:hypothetical protein